MNTDLFSAVLANSFEDTVEDVEWLINNSYISYQTTTPEGIYYWKCKDFIWKGKYIRDNLIISDHWSNDLFKDVLTNSFDDTEENVRWLVDNKYMVYQVDSPSGVYYGKMKDFEWNGANINDEIIKSTHRKRYVK